MQGTRLVQPAGLVEQARRNFEVGLIPRTSLQGAAGRLTAGVRGTTREPGSWARRPVLRSQVPCEYRYETQPGSLDSAFARR